MIVIMTWITRYIIILIQVKVHWLIELNTRTNHRNFYSDGQNSNIVFITFEKSEDQREIWNDIFGLFKNWKKNRYCFNLISNAVSKKKDHLFIEKMLL